MSSVLFQDSTSLKSRRCFSSVAPESHVASKYRYSPFTRTQFHICACPAPASVKDKNPTRLFRSKRAGWHLLYGSDSKPFSIVCHEHSLLVLSLAYTILGDFRAKSRFSANPKSLCSSNIHILHTVPARRSGWYARPSPGPGSSHPVPGGIGAPPGETEPGRGRPRRTWQDLCIPPGTWAVPVPADLPGDR